MEISIFNEAFCNRCMQPLATPPLVHAAVLLLLCCTNLTRFRPIKVLLPHCRTAATSVSSLRIRFVRRRRTGDGERMAYPRRRPLLLAHLFAAPLVKETTGDVHGEETEPGMTPVKQQNYARERDVITRCVEIFAHHNHARCLALIVHR